MDLGDILAEPNSQVTTIAKDNTINMPPPSFIPCPHNDYSFRCSCFANINIKQYLYLFHYDRLCTNKDYNNGHEMFKQNGYYKVERPTWKYNCNTPFGIEYTTFTEKLCCIFDLTCNCTTDLVCLLCRFIVGSPGGGYNPQLYFCGNQQWDLLKLIKLKPFLKYLL